ncbi:hypothetical protein [Methylorubrum salsuginis]|uniref:hypothetical protein n=1 Tax=Methylorubrum salsuginis TaxID=414703 RepID=UPI001041CF34|nr:hypothetical protein [Methylorubrum salsuginis]
MDKVWRFFLILVILVSIHSSQLMQFLFPENEQSYYKINTDTVSYFDTCSSGEEVEHRIIRARISLPIDYDKSKFVDYFRRILDYDLKSRAEHQRIKNIWVEFYIREHPGYDSEGSKPYRFKYFRNGDAWVWLARATKSYPQNLMTNQDK